MSTSADGFAGERKLFHFLAEQLRERPDILAELLSALELLLGEYDTSVRENRFVVGGAAERLVATTLRAVGMSRARARGLEGGDEDIVVPGYGHVSVKGTFTGKREELRLVNTLGSAEGRAWKVPTIFLLAGVGIAYADPALLPNVVRASGDAVKLPRRALDAFLEREPRWLFPCAVPKKPADPFQRRAASDVVLREILCRPGDRFPLLRASL